MGGGGAITGGVAWVGRGPGAAGVGQQGATVVEGAVEGGVDEGGGQQGAEGEKTVQGGPTVAKID